MTVATQIPLLELSGVRIVTPSGRALASDLDAVLDREHVALVGRNGVGKSTLLEVLAGRASPQRGDVVSRTTRWLVPQRLPTEVRPRALLAKVSLPRDELDMALNDAGLPPAAALAPGAGLSGGEVRKLALLEARQRREV